LWRVAGIVVSLVRKLARSAAVLDVAAEPLVARGKRGRAQHGSGLLRNGRRWGRPVFEDGCRAGERKTEGGKRGRSINRDLVRAWIQDLPSLCIEPSKRAQSQRDLPSRVAVDRDRRDARVATKSGDGKRSRTVVPGDEEKGGVV